MEAADVEEGVEDVCSRLSDRKRLLDAPDDVDMRERK